MRGHGAQLARGRNRRLVGLDRRVGARRRHADDAARTVGVELLSRRARGRARPCGTFTRTTPRPREWQCSTMSNPPARLRLPKPGPSPPMFFNGGWLCAPTPSRLEADSQASVDPVVASISRLGHGAACPFPRALRCNCRAAILMVTLSRGKLQKLHLTTCDRSGSTS